MFNLTNYKIECIDVDQISPEFKEKIRQFEAGFTYPFSEQERFRIEHGKGGDYFAFFKSLGKVHYYVATCKKDAMVVRNGVAAQRKAGDIAAVGCGILRKVRTKSGKMTSAWYICDLKVGEKYQGEHLPLMLFQKGAWRYFQASRGYGICMSPPNGPPKAAEIWRNHSPMRGLNTQVLNLYTLSAEQVAAHRADIEKCLNSKFSFASTNGMKDYQIFGPNGQRAWQLLHLEAGERGAPPQAGFVHMLSAVNGSAVDESLKNILGPRSSTAEILSFGMDEVDFNSLTSNQI